MTRDVDANADVAPRSHTAHATALQTRTPSPRWRERHARNPTPVQRFRKDRALASARAARLVWTLRVAREPWRRALMRKTTIADIAASVGTSAELDGWVYNARTGGKLFFLMLRDGTGIIQAVAFKPEIGAEQFAALQTLTQESSVRIWGPVRAADRAGGGLETGIEG